MSSGTALNARTLVDLVRRQADRYGDKVAFRYCPDGTEEEGRLTYREIDLKARAIAARLQQHGAARRRVLVIWQGLDTIPAFFGCVYAGATAVLADDGERLELVAADAQPDFVLATVETQAKVRATIDALAGSRLLEWCAIDEFVEAAQHWAEKWMVPDIDEQSAATIEYTSGSTRSPKGVVVTHRNIVSNLGGLSQIWGGDDEAVGLAWLGLHHYATVLYPIYLGCTVVLMSPLVFLTGPIRYFEAISRHRAAITVTATSLYAECVKRSTPAQRSALDLSCLSASICGTQQIRAADLRAFTQAFAPAGFRPEAFRPSYGLSEATMAVTGGSDSPVPVVQRLDRTAVGSNRVADAAPDDPTAVELVSCGLPLPGLRITIVDPETLRACRPDEIGEIWIAGPSVAQGYWRRPDETERTFSAFVSDTGEGPFLRSGDLGFLRGGELYVTGRWSDLITIADTNYYPVDIEATVQNCHPRFGSGNGAAFAVQPNPRADRHLVVVQEVQRDHQLGQAELADLIGTVRAAVVERHGIEVHDVLLVDTARIPTTPTGKIRRSQCRQQFLDGGLEPVAEWHAAPSSPGGATGTKAPPPMARALAHVLVGLLAKKRPAGATNQRTTKRPGHVSPATKLKFNRWYRHTTQLVESADVVFLNYGYEEDPPMNLPLDQSDEPNRVGIQLYHQTAAQVDLEGKEVLEVSCGHGGGASYLMRTFHPAAYTGVDINSAGIDFCKRRHDLPGLSFRYGDAHELPFPDQAFDVLINIEAAHNYVDFERFLSEAMRVLRPNGYFLYADHCWRPDIPAWEATLAAAPMRLVSQRDINEEVLRALRADTPRRTELVTKYTPPKLWSFYREFAAVAGTQQYRILEQRGLNYRIYCFAKD